jgi:hypothetical protein
MPDGPDDYLPGLEPDEPEQPDGEDTPGEDTPETPAEDYYDPFAPGGIRPTEYADAIPYVPPDYTGSVDDEEMDIVVLTAMGVQWRRSWVFIGGVALATIVAGAMFLSSSDHVTLPGDLGPEFTDTPTAKIQEAGDTADRPVEGEEEPLSSSELAEADEILVAALTKCPLGLVADTHDDPDTKTGAGDSSNTPIDGGFDLVCVGHKPGSHVFTMIVDGDGESLSKADYTSYQVFFVVNNKWPENEFYDDTGFMVLVQWNHLAKQYAGRVSDSGFTPIKDASIDIEWLDVSTLQVVVDLPGDEVDVTETRTEVVVYITDANDNYVYDSFDVAIWTADQ